MGEVVSSARRISAPKVNDALFGAMGETALIRIDLSSPDRNRKTWSEFKKKLQTAKKSLMNLKDIGWLPEDLR